MFHRPLLDLVAHSPGDGPLQEVAERLKKWSAGDPGFDCVFRAVRSGDARPSLRDFFGDPIDRDATISDGGIRMRDILPERPPDGFLDDVGHFLSKEDEGCRVRLSRRFIRVDVQGGQVTLTEHGVLDWERPDHVDVLSHLAFGPSMKYEVPRYELDVPTLVGLMLMKFKSESSRAEDEENWRRLVKFVRRENGLRDERDLDPLKPYLGLLRWPQWRDEFTRKRNSILVYHMSGPGR
jgi:hypothetical protein